MGPMIRIRKEVFKVSQSAMAQIAGVSQPTVSNWETGSAGEPDRESMRRIRAEAVRRGLEWDDAWFFEVS